MSRLRLLIWLLAALAAPAGWVWAEEPAEAVPAEAAEEANKPETAAWDGPLAVIIPVDGMIDGVLYSTLQRRLPEALKLNPRYIFFVLDTWGGEVDAAVNIAKLIHDIPRLEGGNPRTIAYVKTKAISAGALISISCHAIIMNTGTTLGDCAPVIPSQEEGMKILGEKAQSPLRALFREYAEANGYPLALAAGMVSPDLEVLELTNNDGSIRYVTRQEHDDLTYEELDEITKERVVIGEGELLTVSTEEAKEYGFAWEIVSTREGALDFLQKQAGHPNDDTVLLEISWWEGFIRYINSPAVRSLLMLIGMIGVFLAIKTPGYGVPETLAVVCFSIVFFSGYLAGMTQLIEVGMVLAGIVLILLEVFVIPGFGIPGLLGLLLFVTGLFLTGVSFTVPDTPAQWDMFQVNLFGVMGAIGGAVLGIFGLLMILPKVPYGRRVLHTARQKIEDGYRVTSSADQVLMGKRGRAVTPLMPGGKVEIDGEQFDAVAEHGVIDIGSQVEVLKSSTTSLVVRSLESEG